MTTAFVPLHKFQRLFMPLISLVVLGNGLVLSTPSHACMFHCATKYQITDDISVKIPYGYHQINMYDVFGGLINNLPNDKFVAGWLKREGMGVNVLMISKQYYANQNLLDNYNNNLGSVSFKSFLEHLNFKENLMTGELKQVNFGTRINIDHHFVIYGVTEFIHADTTGNTALFSFAYDHYVVTGVLQNFYLTNSAYNDIEAIVKSIVLKPLASAHTSVHTIPLLPTQAHPRAKP